MESTTTTDSNRKRCRDDDNSGGLLSAFEQEAKRSRMVSQQTVSTPHCDPRSNKRSGSENIGASSRFLICHLKMLRSLYRHNHSTNDSISNDNDDPASTCSQTSTDLLDEDVWNQIQQFISHRKTLLSKNQEAQKLQGILAEAKFISQKPPLTAPLKRMNTSLKSQSKLSFSFITQSQQMQIHSLTLNSPSASTIREVDPSPCRFVQNRQSYSNKKTKMRTFNSMNLVNALLHRKYTAAVDAAKKERDPFLPLLENVQKVIRLLTREIVGLKERQQEERNVQCLTEKELWLAAEGIEKEEYEECGDDEEIAVQISRMGLWKALEGCLASVLCD
jgi:hypothetical protein